MPDKYTKVAMHAFIKRGKKYLVLHRSIKDSFKPNEWDLPGGTVEFGENHTKALKREILEETGLIVELIKPLYVYSFVSQKIRHQFQIVNQCKYLEGEVKLNPRDHDDFKWVNKEEMKKLKKIAFLDNFYKDCLLKK